MGASSVSILGGPKNVAVPMTVVCPTWLGVGVGSKAMAVAARAAVETAAAAVAAVATAAVESVAAETAGVATAAAAVWAAGWGEVATAAAWRAQR